MNINSNELLLLNRNLRFGNAAPQPTTPETGSPVNKPETGLNVLQKEGMNNLSFQGGSAVIQKLKNRGLSAMMALTLLAGTGMLTSCEKDNTIIGIPGKSETTITININYDKEEWQKMYEAMMQMWQMMLEQQQITNDQLVQMQQYMLQMMQMIQEGNIDAQEFYAKMFEFMVNNDANQKALMDILIDNGKSQEEANQLIQDLIDQVSSGQLSAAEAMQKILDELGDIGITLDGILDQLKSIFAEISAFRADYNSGKDATLELLGNIYTQGSLNNEILLNMSDSLSKMNQNFENFQASFDEFKVTVGDTTKFDELIEQLKKLEPESIDYQKFEDMFKLLGFTLTDVINMSQAELIEAIKAFEETYINTEKEQNELLNSIKLSLNIVINFPGLDQAGVIEAIEELTNAVNNGNANVTEELQTIQNQLNEIQAQINTMMEQFSDATYMVSSYLNAFKDQFSEALNMLTDIKTDMSELKNQQSIANSYLNSLFEKVDELTVIINEIKDSSTEGGSSITIDELENLLKNLGDANYAKYKDLINNLGIQLSGSTATIEQLLKEINSKMDNQKDYTEQLGRILEILEGINLEAPEYTDKLEQIIKLLENFKCNCNCGADSGDNEGIIGDLEDILG